MRSPTSFFQSNRRGFTLVELLVVVAIIAILIMILLPAIQAAREAARRSQCVNQLNQLTKATMTYESTYKIFPPGMWGPAIGTTTPNQTGSWVGVTALLLPYMENMQLGKDVLKYLDKRPTAGPWWTNANLYRLATQTVPGLICPSDQLSEESKLKCYLGMYTYYQSPYLTVEGVYLTPDQMPDRLARTSYLGMDGYCDEVKIPEVDRFAGLFINRKPRCMKNLRDGTSNTMTFGECCARENGMRLASLSWFSGSLPTFAGFDGKYWYQFSSGHPKIMNFAFADGSVHGISSDIGGLLGTPAGKADVLRGKNPGDKGEMIMDDLSGIADRNESFNAITDPVW
jgi:prepilin-type N-terminal cleavage/methylation domain-containing protein/prepilin-type processing-associated H-X9-DG protein